MKPMFSIIMPIYNVEKNLRQSIDSVIKQEYKDIEVVLIDDGSTDLSTNICREYMNADSRVKYVRKSNGGVSSARNKGIEEARGEYIIFLDGDDVLCEGILQRIANQIKINPHIDLLIGDYIKFFDGFSWNDNSAEKVCFTGSYTYDMNENQNRFAAIADAICTTNSWTRPTMTAQNVIRASVIKENNVRFDTSLSLVEDTDFFCNLYKHINGFVTTGEVHYYYRKARADSASTVLSADKIKMYFDTYYKWALFSKKEHAMKMSCRVARLFVNNLILFSQLEKGELKSIISAYPKINTIFALSGRLKDLALMLAVDIIGRYYAVRLICIIFERRK